MAKDKATMELKRGTLQPVGAMADWEQVRSLRQQIDRLFADFDWPDLRLDWPRKAAMLLPSWSGFGVTISPVDLVERNGGYDLQAELPGPSEDRIKARFDISVLKVTLPKSTHAIQKERMIDEKAA